ncbi:MAG: hypothetical protein ACE5KF_03870 [Kiloniellaceae bacterium]
MTGERHDEIALAWTGAAEGPTAAYKTYSRQSAIEAPGKPALKASADPHLRGDAALDKARTLHEAAHQDCFIASSVNFPVRHLARVTEDVTG